MTRYRSLAYQIELKAIGRAAVALNDINTPSSIARSDPDHKGGVLRGRACSELRRQRGSSGLQ